MTPAENKSLGGRKTKNQKERQETLRELLANKGLAQQVLEISEKLNQNHLSLENSAINALKASADLKCKLLNKYLPDLKQVEAEITGDMGITIKVMQYGHNDTE